MYHEYYGLSERPFDLTPNTRYLYLTPMHREALAAVQYGITSRRGIIVLMQVRDQTMHKEADILDSLDLLVLATVPRMRNAEERRSHRRQVVGLSSVAVAGIGVAIAIAWSWLR